MTPTPTVELTNSQFIYCFFMECQQTNWTKASDDDLCAFRVAASHNNKKLINLIKAAYSGSDVLRFAKKSGAAVKCWKAATPHRWAGCPVLGYLDDGNHQVLHWEDYPGISWTHANNTKGFNTLVGRGAKQACKVVENEPNLDFLAKAGALCLASSMGGSSVAANLKAAIDTYTVGTDDDKGSSTVSFKGCTKCAAAGTAKVTFELKYPGKSITKTVAVDGNDDEITIDTWKKGSASQMIGSFAGHEELVCKLINENISSSNLNKVRISSWDWVSRYKYGDLHATKTYWGGPRKHPNWSKPFKPRVFSDHPSEPVKCPNSVLKTHILSGFKMDKAQIYLPTDLGSNGEMAVGSIIYSEYVNPTQAVKEAKNILGGMAHNNEISSELKIGKIEAWDTTAKAYKTMTKGITVNLGWTPIPYKYKVLVSDNIDGSVTELENNATMEYSRDYGNLAAIISPGHWLQFCLKNESIGWIFPYSKVSFTCQITPASGGVGITLSKADTQKLLLLPTKPELNFSDLAAYGGRTRGSDGWDITEQSDCPGHGFGIDFIKIREGTTGVTLTPGDYVFTGTVGFGNQPWRDGDWRDKIAYASDDGVTEKLMTVILKLKVPTAYYLKPSGGQVTGRRRRRRGS